MNIITILIVAYWLETTVARSLRLKKELSGVSPQVSMHPQRSRSVPTSRR